MGCGQGEAKSKETSLQPGVKNAKPKKSGSVCAEQGKKEPAAAFA